MHLAALADPQDVALLLVLAGSEQLGQIFGSVLIVQIHGVSPLIVSRKRRVLIWVDLNIAGGQLAGARGSNLNLSLV
ncbi:hypothetical protein D3C72_2280090 [compost metagenome]